MTARIVEEKTPRVSDSSEPCVTARVVGEKKLYVMISREPGLTARVVEAEKQSATAPNKGEVVEKASPPAPSQDEEEPRSNTTSAKKKTLVSGNHLAAMRAAPPRVRMRTSNIHTTRRCKSYP